MFGGRPATPRPIELTVILGNHEVAMLGARVRHGSAGGWGSAASAMTARAARTPLQEWMCDPAVTLAMEPWQHWARAHTALIEGRAAPRRRNKRPARTSPSCID
jgi:hypothetical protein